MTTLKATWASIILALNNKMLTIIYYTEKSEELWIQITMMALSSTPGSAFVRGILKKPLACAASLNKEAVKVLLKNFRKLIKSSNFTFSS